MYQGIDTKPGTRVSATTPNGRTYRGVLVGHNHDALPLPRVLVRVPVNGGRSHTVSSFAMSDMHRA